MSVLKNLSTWQRFPPIVLILILGLIHGGFYIFLVPPWQHSDEPTQFEYAWLIANQGKLPDSNSYDSEMHREVTASMVEYEFFNTLPPPNLLLEKTWIGISQTNDQPLYYLLSAIPLWILKGTDITLQLYAVRLMSFCMFLLTIYISYRLTTEIFPQHKTLQWLFPASIALIPAFVDLMTAVNNDVGATLMFSLFLWVGTRLITKGITVSRVLFFILISVGCFQTKNTILVAVPSAVFLLLLTLFLARFPWNRIALPMVLIYLGFAGLFLFSWGDAAYWYRSQLSTQQTVPTRSIMTEAVLNNSFLHIQFVPGEKSEQNLLQPLSSEVRTILAGKNYSLGAWIWASEPVQVQAPVMSIDGATSFQFIQLEETPSFFAITGEIPKDSKQLHILLDPLISPLDHSVSIYFDNIVLAEGKYPLDKIPTLSNDNASGTWGNKKFVNLARNSSVEKSWITFKPHLLFQFRGQTSIPVYALPAMQDFELTNRFYRNTAKNLFESFWARFGWNHVALPPIFYKFLKWFTFIGVFGTIMGFFQQLSKRETKFLLLKVWFATCTSLIWSAALARQTLPFWDTVVFTPSARYAYPVIIPTMMIIMAGWYFITTRNEKTKILAYLPIAFLVILDITSLIVVIQFYYSG
jgi:hypothetical protein